MAALTALYAFLLFGRGVVLIQDGTPIAVAMGVAILVFPLLAIWVLFAEIRFGVQLAKLGKLFSQSGIAEPSYQLLPSGRADRESGEQVFQEIANSVNEDEENYLLWYLLADSYDKLGDRKRARKAARTAISIANQAGAL